MSTCRLLEVWDVPFDYSRVCWKLVEVRGVHLDCRKGCWNLVEDWESILSTEKRV